MEITKAQLELAKMKSVSAEPQTPSLGQPCLLQAAITSTPESALGSGIPALEQLREKKKPGSTLLNNFVFSTARRCMQARSHKHLQLLMARASTYNWSSVRSFHLSIATAIDQGRLLWSDCDAIRERSQTLFTHQVLHMQPRTSRLAYVVMVAGRVF